MLSGLVLALAQSIFDERIAVDDIWLAQATGCDTGSLQSWSCGLACAAVPLSERLLAVNSSKKTLAIVGRRAQTNACIVAIRGSKTFRNWIQDADFPLVDFADCDGCKVHGGFLSDWRSLQVQVAAHLQTLGCSAANGSIVEITGRTRLSD